MAASGHLSAPHRLILPLNRPAGEGSAAVRVPERIRRDLLTLLQRQGVSEFSVLRAVSTTPRSAFVDEGLSSRAYDDVPLPIAQGQTISRPSTVARMIQWLVVARRPGGLRALRVLEIGTGSGYQAVVLARIFGDVVSIERVRWLHDRAKRNVRPFHLNNLRLMFGDGTLGVPAGAPYDVIISSAAGSHVPVAWLNQMAVGGRLVAPVSLPDSPTQALHVMERIDPERWTLSVLDEVRFVPLRSGTSG